MVSLNLEVANKIERGVVFPADRSYSPAKCHYIPRSHEDLKESAGVSYQAIDQLADQGLIEISSYRGFNSIRWTYEGKKRHLELAGWDKERWLEYYANRICCYEALPLFCVCEVRTICKHHGKRCKGSHD